MRFCSRALRIAFGVSLFLVTAHRLPAPIVEQTPAPKPKAKRSITETKNRATEPTQSKAAKSTVSFAGTWTGTAHGRLNEALLGQRDASSNYKIHISPDERTVNWTSSAWFLTKFQAPVQKKGRTLSWACEKHNIAGTTTVNCSLEMQANGTAKFSESSGLVNGVFKGKGYEFSGMLVRQ